MGVGVGVGVGVEEVPPPELADVVAGTGPSRFEVAVASPWLLPTRTTARRNAPATAVCTVYVCAVAPSMLAQLDADEHRCQRYEKDNGFVPRHVPVETVTA